MKFVTITLPTVTRQKKDYFSSAIKSLRLVMLTVLFPFLLNLSLSSCTKTDTIVPAESQSVTSAAREMASVLNVDGFEDSQVESTIWYKELRTPTAGLFSTEQHRAGKQSIRFAWKPTQYDGTNPTMHSELAARPLINGETERWYGYSLYMPAATMKNDKQTTIITQWHGVPDPNFFDTVPPMAVSLEPDGNMSLIYRSNSTPITKPLQYPTTTEKNVNLGAAPFDRWIDFVVHIKWDPTNNQGVLEFWQDGVKKVSEHNISIGYLQQTKPYFKIGLYCWTGKASHDERTLYYDEVRVGDASSNYDAVKPGRKEGTAKEQRY